MLKPAPPAPVLVLLMTAGMDERRPQLQSALAPRQSPSWGILGHPLYSRLQWLPAEMDSLCCVFQFTKRFLSALIIRLHVSCI